MNSRGYAAAYKHLESLAQTFDPPSPHLLNNNPSFANYNPSASRTTNSTYSSTGTSNHGSNNSHVQHQQPHHALLVSLGVYHPQQQQPQHHRHQQQQQQASSYNSYEPQLSFFDPLPISTNHHDNHQHQHQHPRLHPRLSPIPASMLAAAAGAVAAAAAPLNSNHRRMTSLEEFLMLNPGILSSSTFDPLPIAVSSSNSNNSTNPSLRGASPPTTASSSLEDGAAWMDELMLDVPGISVEPLTARQLVKKVQQSLNNVTQRYIPCVDFLVQCQQDLRRGLAQQQQHLPHQRGHRRPRSMTARQFYAAFVQNLPQRFHMKNQYSFQDKQALQKAVSGLHELILDAHSAERLGSAEAVKNQFLGGMKDGQSWGLRKWMAHHGNALNICTNLECIHQAVTQKLDRNADSTRKMAMILRPMASEALKRLQADVPKTYQAHSSAHPYLPFFHRLESALRSMAQFDPDDDDVIVLDNSSDEDEGPAPVVSSNTNSSTRVPRKRPASASVAKQPTAPSRKRQARAGGVRASAAAASPKPPPPAAAAAAAANDSFLNGVRGVTTEIIECLCDSDDDDDDDTKQLQQNPTPPLPETNDDDDDDSSSNGWKCPSCNLQAYSSSDTCEHCGEVNFLKDLMYDGTVEALLDSGSSDNGDLTTLRDNAGSPLVDDDDDDDDDDSLWEDTKPLAEMLKKNNHFKGGSSTNGVLVRAGGPQWPLPLSDVNGVYASSLLMANSIDRVAAFFDENQQEVIRPPGAPFGNFWDGDRYASALKLFSSLLRKTDAAYFVEAVDEEQLIRLGNPPFSHVVRHPLCFRDIAASLIQDVEGDDAIPFGLDGLLPARGLNAWNMWKGMDLLQAIDLVFLNSLAYGKSVDDSSHHPKASHRSKTNKLRKDFWDGIHRIVMLNNTDAERRRLCTPTRRAESSGFVVYKQR